MSEKTVKVRIAVAVDQFGNWSSAGWKLGDGCSSENADQLEATAIETLDSYAERLFWVNAELPIPQPEDVIGKVDPTPTPGADSDG